MKKKIKDFRLTISHFFKNNKTEFWVLVTILIVGAFFRLYRIGDYMTFLGDEGRDVIIVRRIFTELHPPLIGPGTSVGGIYLGPLYYYLMAIPLLIAGFSPIGPAVMVALLSVATIAFIWWVGRSWFDKKAGIIAAAFYAISPTVIIFSHSSWNPNIMPFFALLSIYSIRKIWAEKKYNWLIVLGISYAFVLQSHYLGLLLFPTLFLFWVLSLKNSKSEISNFIRKSLLGLGFFLILMSPLFIFDLRHDFMNTKLIYKFLVERENVIAFDPVQTLSGLPRIFNLVNGSLLAGKQSLVGVLTSWLILVGTLTMIVKNKFKLKKEYWIIIVWFGFGLLGLSFYKQSIYDHYFGFLYPVPFLFMGIIISGFLKGKIIFKLIGVLLLACLVFFNLKANPLRSEPNKLLARSINVSKVIEENSSNQPFNLAVIADTNYEDGYKYFLLKDNYPVVDIDSQNPETITDQLFVVCELYPNSKCDPTHSAKAQVANFGWSKIENVWEVNGATVYKLVHVVN